MRTLTVLLLAFMPMLASAAEVEAFASVRHTSDLFRGAPFNKQDALQLDGLSGGFTINAGKRRAWEIDLQHGFQRIDRARVEQFSALDVRFYPGRLR